MYQFVLMIWWLMGMLWDEKLFIDTTLPFGLRSAPKVFTALADAIEWIARQQGIRFTWMTSW